MPSACCCGHRSSLCAVAGVNPAAWDCADADTAGLTETCCAATGVAGSASEEDAADAGAEGETSGVAGVCDSLAGLCMPF